LFSRQVPIRLPQEALELLSIGRTSLYEAVKRGDLKLVKFGKKTLVYATDIAPRLLSHP
jgi:excisionase family DNA binding protein